MSFFHKFSKINISESDIDVLKMYLDGATMSEIELYLCSGDKERVTKSNYNAKEKMQKIRSMFKIPFHQKQSIVLKEQILKNLDLVLAYESNLENFIKAENQKLIDGGFKDLTNI